MHEFRSRVSVGFDATIIFLAKLLRRLLVLVRFPVFIDVEETPQVVDKAFHSSSANGGARDKVHSAEEKSTEKEKKQTERERERESKKKRGRVKGSRLFSETSRRGATLLFPDEDSVSGRAINLYNYCFL